MQYTVVQRQTSYKAVQKELQSHCEQGTGDYKAKSIYEAGGSDKKVKSSYPGMGKLPKV